MFLVPLFSSYFHQYYPQIQCNWNKIFGRGNRIPFSLSDWILLNNNLYINSFITEVKEMYNRHSDWSPPPSSFNSPLYMSSLVFIIELGFFLLFIIIRNHSSPVSPSVSRCWWTPVCPSHWSPGPPGPLLASWPLLDPSSPPWLACPPAPGSDCPPAIKGILMRKILAMKSVWVSYQNTSKASNDWTWQLQGRKWELLFRKYTDESSFWYWYFRRTGCQKVGLAFNRP